MKFLKCKRNKNKKKKYKKKKQNNKLNKKIKNKKNKFKKKKQNNKLNKKIKKKKNRFNKKSKDMIENKKRIKKQAKSFLILIKKWIKQHQLFRKSIEKSKLKRLRKNKYRNDIALLSNTLNAYCFLTMI